MGEPDKRFSDRSFRTLSFSIKEIVVQSTDPKTTNTNIFRYFFCRGILDNITFLSIISGYQLLQNVSFIKRCDRITYAEL